MKKIILLSAAVVFATVSIIAQGHAKKGDYSFLKGEKSFNIEYVYDNMTIGKKLTEEEYVNKKVADYNKKEAGKGDKWKESWEGARDKRFEPKFESLINKSMEKIGMTASENIDAKYTLIVKTIYIEPGAQAMGFDFDTGSRVAECYAKGGKMLGAYIYKNLK